MKRMLAVLAALVLTLGGLPAARAEDVCSIDASAVPGTVSTEQSYLRVTCPLPEETEVVLSVFDAGGSLCYQRSYGLCSGSFRSEDIYLRLSGGNTRYQVSLSAGNACYAFEVLRCMPRLNGNAACAVGYPLSSLTGRDSWQSATLLDVAALEGSSRTVALHASGAYELGTVTFSVHRGQLTVSASLSGGVDGTIDDAQVFVALNAADAGALGGKRFAGLTGRLDQAIDLEGAACVAVYVQLTVSFDPTGVPGSPRVELDGQEALWEHLQEITASEAVG